MTAPDRDDEFEAFLQRRTLLPHGDDAAEPPRALDEIVLQKARAAIQGGSLPQRQTGSPSTRAARWATPVALAATILLCLSIVLNVTLNTNRPVRSPVALDATVPEPSASARADAPTPADSAADTNASASAPAPAPAAPPAVAARASKSAPAPALAAKRESEVMEGLQERKADVAEDKPQDSRFAGASPANAQALAKAAAEAAHPQDPKAWLQRIDALRAEGKTAEADAEMQRFRAAFPRYPVKPAAPGAH